MNKLLKAQGVSAVRSAVELYLPNSDDVARDLANVRMLASEDGCNSSLDRAIDELSKSIRDYRVRCVEAVTALFV